MSLYDKSSIALIPSGTKASKLYSVLPANGDGDFTHSRGSTATRVNKDGLIESVAIGEARLDYPLTNGLVGDCPHLLLEPSRTNGLQRTEEFDNSYWNKSLISVTANDSVSPDGSQNADKIVSGNSTGNHFFRRTSLTYSATDNTFSIFAKFTDDLFEQFHIVIYDGSNHFVYFDVKNGSVISADSGITASMINYGNGWYRCIASYQTASTSIGQIKVELGDSTSETGDGTSGMLFWGIQWEVGSYQTSYISWDGSGTTTRSTDVCNDSGTSAQVNNDAGAFFVEIQGLEEGSSASRRITLSDESTNNRLLIETDESTGVFKFFIAGGGTVRGVATSTGNTQTDMNKLAIGYDGVNAKAYINGTQVGSITNATTRTGMDTVDIADWNGTSNVYFGRVKQVIYFNEALTDSELATLTS